MANFVFVQYEGDDAGAVLSRVMGGEPKPDEPAELDQAEYARRIIGFQPNPEVEEAEKEPDDEG